MNRHERRKAAKFARIARKLAKKAQREAAKALPKFPTPSKLNPSHAQMQRDVKAQNEILREEKRRADRALAEAHRRIAELQLKLGALAREV
jgi:hypothetical protein